MKSIDNVGVTFVNVVMGRGVLNGVVNVQFGSYQFTPSEDGKFVEPDLVLSSRLRMDRVCAQQLHEALGSLLEIIEKTEAEALSDKTLEETPSRDSREKPN